MARRYYSSTAVATTLSASANNSDTSITVTALSGYPVSTPWTAIIDPDTASEEVVEVTNVSGTTLTVTRGVDGTSGTSHSAGAVFRHGVSARDFDEANAFVNGGGVANSLVGVTVAPVNNPTFSGVASFPDGSASAPSVTNDGDTNTGLFFPAADTVAVTTGGTERLRLDSGGAVLVGDTAKRTYIHLNTSPMLQVNGTTNSTASIGVARYANATAGAVINLYKSRSATVGTATTVTTGDTLGIITWSGVDTGNVGRRAGLIDCVAEGTIGAGIVPGRLGFYTTDDAGAIAERMRIDRNGLITGTGTSLGAWTTYTPTLGGTGWAIGNGTASGVYCQIGKVVVGRVLITLGSTSTAGAGALTVSAPVSAVNVGNQSIGSGFIYDSSLTQRHDLSAMDISGGAFAPFAASTTTTGTITRLTTTVPFTWGDSDFISFDFRYEAA